MTVILPWLPGFPVAVYCGRSRRRYFGAGSTAGITFPRYCGFVFGWFSRFRDVCQGGLRRRPSLADVLVALVTFGLGVLIATQTATGHSWSSGLYLVTGAISCAALVARRCRPLVVLGFVLGWSSLVAVVVGRQGDGPSLIAIWVALYSVAAYRPRKTAWIAASGTIALLLPPALTRDDAVIQAVAGAFLWVVTVTSAGCSVRDRRAYQAAVEDRALRAEQSREQEAWRRVVEERTWIARELHDVVAHHITLVKSQAAVASHLLYEQPAKADEALAHIRLSSRTVLNELGSLVSVLRDTPESTSTEPPPGLARLPELISAFQAIGMTVSCTVTAAGSGLPPLVDLATYRIVQESLTNIRRHAPDARTSVQVDRFRTEVRLRIHNTRPGGVAPTVGYSRLMTPGWDGTAETGRTPGGHGIAGMRERARAVGGWLDAGPDAEGGFAVTAMLPVPKEASASSPPSAAPSPPSSTRSPMVPPPTAPSMSAPAPVAPSHAPS